MDTPSDSSGFAVHLRGEMYSLLNTKGWCILTFRFSPRKFWLPQISFIGNVFKIRDFVGDIKRTVSSFNPTLHSPLSISLEH